MFGEAKTKDVSGPSESFAAKSTFVDWAGARDESGSWVVGWDWDACSDGQDHGMSQSLFLASNTIVDTSKKRGSIQNV